MDLKPRPAPSIKRLTSWIEHRLDVDHDEAAELAEAMRTVFDEGTVITDWDVPDKPTRAALYKLYRHGLVETHTIEKPRPEDGRLWRYHHWVLALPKGWPAKTEDEGKPETGRQADDPYLQLPNDVWERSTEPAEA